MFANSCFITSATEQDLGLLPFLQRYLGVVLRVLEGCCRIVVQFFVRPALQRRKRLVAGNRQKRARNLRSALKSSVHADTEAATCRACRRSTVFPPRHAANKFL